MDEEKITEETYNFTVINGTDVRVNHCLRNYRCSLPACCGTDCKNYLSKHPEVTGGKN